MKQIFNYNVHNILEFRIIREKRHDILGDVNFPFRFFEVKEIDQPEIILNIGKFTPSNSDCYAVEHKYYIKENYFYCKDSAGRARWEAEIKGFEDNQITVNFNSANFAKESFLYPDLFPQEIVLKPLLEYKLFQKGYPLIHSGAISKNNQAYLLAGRGSSSKTTIIINLVRNAGMDFLSDDQIIIRKEGILSFPKQFGQFSFMTKYLPTEHYRGLWDKIHLVRYLQSKPDYKEGISVIPSSSLKALFFIVRSNKETISKRRISLETALDKLVIGNMIDMETLGPLSGLFLRYMLAYSFIFPHSKIATYWDDLRRSLGEILERIPAYEIEIPSKYDSNVFDRVLGFIKEA